MVKLPRGALFWFTFYTWRPFLVVLADEKACPDLETRWGFCDTIAGIVWLHNSLPLESLVRLFFHEGLHAVWSEPGEDDLLAHLMGCKKRESNQREEYLAVHTSRKQADAFMRSGLLKFPPLPKKKGHR